MIDVYVLAGRDPAADQVTIEDVGPLLDNPAALLWIDLADPTSEDFARLSQQFRFHPLAMEDAEIRHQRPKLNEYDDFLFLVFYSVRVTSSAAMFGTQEIALFVGSNYLVTVHSGLVPEVQTTLQRWRKNVSLARANRVAVLLYSLLDEIVDNYFPVLDAVAERTDELEEAIFRQHQTTAMEEIFRLRKALLAVRRVLAPERDLMGILTRRDIELLGPDTAVYFQDVYDHVLRVTDALDTYRDLLASALDAYLSVVSNNLNQVMRTLTSWSIILMLLALVAGVYGMNFVNMPELSYRWGYFVTLAGMAAIAAGLFAVFKRIRWL